MDSENQQICRDFVRPVILPLLSRQPPETQAFRGVCPYPGLIFCTLLPLLGTLATIPPPSFLSNSTIATNVGYQTIDAPAAGNYKALSVAFDNVGSAKSYPIATLISCDAPKGAASALTSADQIWLWDTTGNDWVKYFYLKKGTQPAVGWCKKGETTVTTDTISSGETFFFYRGTGGAATTLTLSGEVKAFTAQPEYDAPAAGNYKFIGYPWPVAMPIGGFEKYQGAPKGAASALTSADQIWLWDTTGNDWVKYFYLKKGTQAAVGWCKKGETTVTTDSIPAGQGFFFYRGTGGAADKITFTYDAN